MQNFVNRWHSFYKSVCISGNSIALNNLKDKLWLQRSNFADYSCDLVHGRHYYLDPQVDPKIAKRHFFQDIQNSFEWITGIGLKMPHFFSS